MRVCVSPTLQDLVQLVLSSPPQKVVETGFNQKYYVAMPSVVASFVAIHLGQLTSVLYSHEMPLPRTARAT